MKRIIPKTLTNTYRARLITLLTLFISFSFPLLSQASYTPPLGIPAPSFGIDEIHTIYAGKTYDYSGDGTPDGPYKDAGNGPYTHYIDINNASCSDTSNEFGSKNTPRCNLPDGTALQPGAVVEIHGGAYVPNSTEYRIISSGTAVKPIFFRGVSVNNRPVFERVLRIRGSYIIIENIEFNKNQRYEAAIDIRPDTNVGTTDTVHHVAVRNCEFLNFYNKDNQITNAGALIDATTYVSGDIVHDIVYYNNKIHPDSLNIYNDASPFEADYHCIGVSSQTEDIWILENEIYNCTGDLIGNGNSANHTGKRYYIGKNTLHSAGENAIDIKEIDTVIISENTIYDFQGPSSGSDGTALVFHYGATAISAKDIWVINNIIYNAKDKAIQIGGDEKYPVYILGNVIHDITNSTTTGTAIASWTSFDIYAMGNTIYNVDTAVSITGDSTHKLYLFNNIISNITPGGKIFDIGYSAYRSNAEIDYNLFYDQTGSISIQWDSSSYTLADFKTTTGKCSNCKEADPLFLNTVTNNFNLNFGSPAAENGVDKSPIYNLIPTSIDIKKDITGTPRPRLVNWDIGAYENIPPLNNVLGTINN